MYQRNLIALLLSLSLFACSSLGTAVQPDSASIIGSVEPVGSPEIRELPSTTETVSNCGGGNTTIVKHPSMSVTTSHTVEWEVGGEVGAGVTIGEGIIPGGVNLSGAFDAHIINGNQTGVEQSTGWDLPAPPNTIVVYTLTWQEAWQPGVVEVRLPDQSVLSVNVSYRTRIDSNNVGSEQLSCDGSPATSEPSATEPPPATIPPVTGATDTPSGTILESGQIWRQGGLELYLESTELFTGSMCEGPGVVLRFYLSNYRTSEVLITLRPDTFSAVDNTGNRFKLIWTNENVNFSGEINESFVLEAGSTVPLPHPGNSIEVICIQADVANPSISEFTVMVSNLSSINDAKWRIPINR